MSCNGLHTTTANAAATSDYPADYLNGTVTFEDNVLITGNMTCSGTLATYKDVAIEDTTFIEAYNNTADILNTAYLSQYTVGGVTKYAGLVRKAGGTYCLVKDETDDKKLGLTTFDTLRIGGLKNSADDALTLPSGAQTLLGTAGSAAMTGALANSTEALSVDYANNKIISKVTGAYQLWQGSETNAANGETVLGDCWQHTPAYKTAATSAINGFCTRLMSATGSSNSTLRFTSFRHSGTTIDAYSTSLYTDVMYLNGTSVTMAALTMLGAIETPSSITCCGTATALGAADTVLAYCAKVRDGTKTANSTIATGYYLRVLSPADANVSARLSISYECSPAVADTPTSYASSGITDDIVTVLKDKVGIATATPTEVLDVTGDIKVSGSLKKAALTFTLPAASGTLALTSGIMTPAYACCHLTGSPITITLTDQSTYYAISNAGFTSDAASGCTISNGVITISTVGKYRLSYDIYFAGTIGKLMAFAIKNTSATIDASIQFFYGPGHISGNCIYDVTSEKAYSVIASCQDTAGINLEVSTCTFTVNRIA